MTDEFAARGDVAGDELRGGRIGIAVDDVEGRPAGTDRATMDQGGDELAVVADRRERQVVAEVQSVRSEGRRNRVVQIAEA